MCEFLNVFSAARLYSPSPCLPVLGKPVKKKHVLDCKNIYWPVIGEGAREDEGCGGFTHPWRLEERRKNEERRKFRQHSCN